MTEKPPLLFLCHRIPYPPNKGDKIRSWHLLDHLADFFTVYLATFVDDPADHRYEAIVRAKCADALFIPLSPLRARLLSARALLLGEALSLAYYRSDRMQSWVNAKVQEHMIDRAFVFCSPMIQYLRARTPRAIQGPRVVLDLVDVDSEKWRQYAVTRRGPIALLYAREARKLLKAERAAARQAEHTFLVSAREAELFRGLAPECAASVGYFKNGVASHYFAPNSNLINPFFANEVPLVFTGAMDYWPNVDAVIWFALEVLPMLRKRHPRIVFYIVGSKPTEAVVALADREDVVVTGRVDDVRPYLQHAVAAVAPLRVARGIQNKVLEAMAMARTVLASSAGLEGIGAVSGETVICCDSPSEYDAAIEQLLQGLYRRVATRARRFVEDQYSWERNLEPVREALL
ncbi:MAG: TIGR03087 family PEP-CTERM/XrtA system glycosyltransferase [Pseudomonadota bacterium]